MDANPRARRPHQIGIYLIGVYRTTRAARRGQAPGLTHERDVGMGFNPFREQEHSILDVVLVVGAIAVTLALVVWGFFGS